jgi:hypothetical protein
MPEVAREGWEGVEPGGVKAWSPLWLDSLEPATDVGGASPFWRCVDTMVERGCGVQTADGLFVDGK